jgi:hypothetical protein
LLPLDGLFNNVAYSTATWTRSGAVATVTTAAAHGFAIGQQVVVAVSSDLAAIPLGMATLVSVPSGTSYTFACPNAGATSGTLTIGIVAAANALANRGDMQGYTIRVIDNGAGGSGKVETRKIIGNTGGVQPIVELSSPLSFTPVAGSSYEIRSGRVYMLNPGTAAAGQWKYYDPATNTVSGNLGVTNLAVATDSALFHMSEDYVPNDRKPGEGFVNGGATANLKNCIQATAASSTSITGSGMPADLLADEYRNFQIRKIPSTSQRQASGAGSHPTPAAPRVCSRCRPGQSRLLRAPNSWLSMMTIKSCSSLVRHSSIRTTLRQVLGTPPPLPRRLRPVAPGLWLLAILELCRMARRQRGILISTVFAAATAKRLIFWTSLVRPLAFGSRIFGMAGRRKPSPPARAAPKTR